MRWIESFNPSAAERATRALATLAAVALACLAVSCAMTELTEVKGHQFPKPESCAHCHVEIYDEWSRSPHARAFVNERFRDASDGHRFNDCIGCHAPQPTLVTAEPVARDADRHLGVVCVSCHLDNGQMVGPLPPTGMAKPHPIRTDPAPFANGKLCGHCHQGELRQWELATIDDKPDCRVCHMPAVERKMTQATSFVSKIFVGAEESTTEHRHLFLSTPNDLPFVPFTLDVVIRAREAMITLTNKLPHNLPTGDFGVRVVEVRADGIRHDNVAPETLAQWELTNFGRDRLASGEARRWTVAVPDGLVALRVHVSRHGRDANEGTVLLRKEVPLP